MVFTDASFEWLSRLQFNVRAALARSSCEVAYQYEGEQFFRSYEALRRVWQRRESQRQVATSLGIGRTTLGQWEESFVTQGALGLLSEVPHVEVDPLLERLVVVVRSARAHANSASIVTLAEALKLPGPSLERVYRIQRSYGWGQRLDDRDRRFYDDIQKIMSSIQYLRSSSSKKPVHDRRRRAETFRDFDHDPFQHRIELFKELASCTKRRQVRAILQSFGIHSGRFYELKQRYLSYGIRGLVDLVHVSRRTGEEASSELELRIIEEHLSNPALSTRKRIQTLDLKCSRANVQKIVKRWNLSRITQPVSIRGVLATGIPEKTSTTASTQYQSAKLRFPDLIQTAGLKLHRSFSDLLDVLTYRSVPVSNPGAIIVAPFLDQLGVVEAIHTYGPPTYRTTEITNDIIVNVLRIIVGFPTVNGYMQNSDRSVAIGAGLLATPSRSRFYRGLDDFRFDHLQDLRNDLAARAKELNTIQGKQIAVDYHCDPSDSRYPRDKGLSKAPDKKGDVVYAHRPHIVWDSMTNSIINIAYCEGRSRAPSSLYSFLEDNLFKVIDSSAIAEIYADSEYTGEKQLVYLHVRSGASITMCLKQNPKIRKWKEETLQSGQWMPYGDLYRIASRDYILAETGKPFRFVVKQNTENHETRCFGSTHVDWSPEQILDKYHIRWPVETGIKDLIENYYLNKPTGDSPEKVEAHYYCVMISRTLVDYFSSVFCEPQWTSPAGWESVLSTIRTTVFSNQNCELSLTRSGDLQLTYLDGDPNGIKANLAQMLQKRKAAGLNHVSWWGGRGVKINVEDRFNLASGPGTA